MAKDDKQQEHAAVTNDAKKAAELAHTNIQRFLSLQAEREAALIMKAHEQNIVEAAKAASAASELAALNIRRFLDLQATREASLIMQAHQVAADKPERKA